MNLLFKSLLNFIQCLTQEKRRLNFKFLIRQLLLPILFCRALRPAIIFGLGVCVRVLSNCIRFWLATNPNFSAPNNYKIWELFNIWAALFSTCALEADLVSQSQLLTQSSPSCREKDFASCFIAVHWQLCILGERTQELPHIDAASACRQALCVTSERAWFLVADAARENE